MKPLAAAALAAALFTSAPTAGAQQKTVVFVCEHGTVKSLVAIEHFNKLARERGLAIVAVSRGTNPDSVVPGPVRQGLARDGFDVSLFHPQRLATRDLASAVLLVAFDADVSPLVGDSRPVTRWDNLPSISGNYDAGRSAIVARVRTLVDSLATARGGGKP